MHLTGVILDIYDDPKAVVLLEKLAGRELPKELGDSELLEPTKLASMPDRLFGLVATNAGETVRKYAMHDAPHTTTSVLYFLSQYELLPASAQKVAAQNLIEACGWYGLEVPELLEKIAIDPLGGVMGALDVKNRVEQSVERHRATMDGFRQAQAGASADMQAAPDRPPTQSKQADLTGTEMMPMMGSISTYPDPKNTARQPSSSSSSKRAGWSHAGDLTDHRPVKKVASMIHTRFAMPSKERYPIDGYGDVKTASEYFDNHMNDFKVEDRREFAFHLGQRLEELSLPLTENVAKYAGDGYGPHIDVELFARVRNFEGFDHADAYAVLIEKKASVPPHVMLEMIHELDEISGAATKYDAPLGFRDPYQAVYGKTAGLEPAKSFSWSEGNEYTNDTMLTGLATRRYAALDHAFGKEMRLSFQKDPVGVFQSMPDPQKIVIARLASDESLVG